MAKMHFLFVVLFSSISTVAWATSELPGDRIPDPRAFDCEQKAEIFARQMVLERYGPKEAIADYKIAVGQFNRTIRTWVIVTPRITQLSSRSGPVCYVGYIDFDADNCRKPEIPLTLTPVSPSSLD